MSKEKPICRYGENCYRLQEDHLSEYTHPHLDSILKQCNPTDIQIPASYQPKVSADYLLRQLKVLHSLKSKESGTRALESSQLTPSASGNAKSKMDTTSMKRGLSNYMEYVSKRCKGDVLEKIRLSEPYRFFLSGIAVESRTHDETLTLSFPELLSEKLGVLESSLQINFMVQISWLLAQYAVNKTKSTPITLLYGSEDSELTEAVQKGLLPNVKAHYLKPSAFGSHHTKMMILSYEDQSIRVIVTTGNLIEFDWENTTQGIWVSPRLPYIESKGTSVENDSETNFKKDLLKYLEFYNLPIVRPWIEKVQNADFREVKVFFVASVPGTHPKEVPAKWGLHKLGDWLAKKAQVTSADAKNWPLYYQCSSIGSLGKEPQSWLLGEVTRIMSSCNACSFQPPVKVIYPTFDDVFSSYDGLAAGGCLPYGQNTHDKQTWLTQYLCKWRSAKRYRDRAMPHIKSYCRLSPCKKYLSWFLLTSANLSKAAWGMETKKRELRILNYEVGVLFVPSVLISKNRLPLTNENSSEDGPQFSLPYDIPVTPYSSGDAPWVIDMLQNAQ